MSDTAIFVVGVFTFLLFSGGCSLRFWKFDALKRKRKLNGSRTNCRHRYRRWTRTDADAVAHVSSDLVHGE
jgi:hypothetical protein